MENYSNGRTLNKPRIGIVDYGMGNIRSVANAVDEVGGVEDLILEPEKLSDYDKLILPGVGAFGQAISVLKSTGLHQALNEYKDSGKPILGICLGMQLMCMSSEEGGSHSGLGWFDASVKAFPVDSGLVVPHMGWNDMFFSHEERILKNVNNGSDFYFLHGYFVECSNEKDVLGKTEYGIAFSSMISKENVYGIQFHPEKSQAAGLQLLKNFSEI